MISGSEIIQLRARRATRTDDRHPPACGSCACFNSCAWARAGMHADPLMHIKTRRSGIPSKVTLFDEGDHLDSVSCLLTGQVILSKTLRDGRRQILGFAQAGDLFGTEKDEVAHCTAMTITHAEVCRIDRIHFRDILVHSSQFLERLYKRGEDQLSVAREHLLLLGRLNAEERLATFILQMQERCGSHRIALPLTRQDIGDYLGLTLETVSRTFTKLARRKLIAIIPDGVRILNLDELRQLAEC